jgi:hypothetical protein
VQLNIARFRLHQHNTNNISLTFFNNTQKQHNDMTQNVDIVGQPYIAINIVNVCTTANSAERKNWHPALASFIGAKLN